ncbi:hypothetical protein NDU88_004806 [Pleurodeles waltl]|uniref:Uncharacterized protein n=1 Tax=Pleurodeles waltl TaxID=8319 RepID=A0AAV7WWJ5_PLEWA|nr:hypothetical protein NDU88_004806 [Pleurodeles waltl]
MLGLPLHTQELSETAEHGTPWGGLGCRVQAALVIIKIKPSNDTPESRRGVPASQEAAKSRKRMCHECNLFVFRRAAADSEGVLGMVDGARSMLRGKGGAARRAGTNTRTVRSGHGSSSHEPGWAAPWRPVSDNGSCRGSHGLAEHPRRLHKHGAARVTGCE